MRVALDAMGGDHAPADAVEGALLHVRRQRDDELLLVGDEPRVRAELQRLGPSDRIQIRHAPDVVGMDEAPTAVRRRPQSSIRVCFDLVKRGEADAVVSAGNSGAAMASALLVLGRLEHVERPAIAAMLPTLKGGFTVLLDCGANVVCRASHLVQFAHLGEVYARRLLGVARPRVGLLSNGEEPSKGTDATRAALQALTHGTLDFAGYVEGKDLFAGDVDVIVTDGFTGNVALKTSEGAAAALGAMLKREIERRTTARLGALLMAPAFAAFKKIVDYAEYGGAPLVGIDGVGIVAHGRSTSRAFHSAIRAASMAASMRLSVELSAAAARAKALMHESAGRRGIPVT